MSAANSMAHTSRNRFTCALIPCRSLLDFDFEKLCSITLSNNNVYACLVCGKYFQGECLFTCCQQVTEVSLRPGRGQKSCAYTHSVEVEHHVFINLHSLQFFCLPDNYEIIDSSLDDIKVSERERDGDPFTEQAFHPSSTCSIPRTPRNRSSI